MTESFFEGLPFSRVVDPASAGGDGPLVASLLDLAATKVKVVQDRAEAKDYIDVARLLAEGISLADALGATLAVYGSTFNPLLSLRALAYFGDGDLPSLPKEIRATLDPRYFLARVMASGMFDEVRCVREHFPPEAFRAVLEDPRAGVFDPRSWAYWNLVFEREAGEVPRRRLPA